jgi:hypothetical protein
VCVCAGGGVEQETKPLHPRRLQGTCCAPRPLYFQGATATQPFSSLTAALLQSQSVGTSQLASYPQCLNSRIADLPTAPAPCILQPVLCTPPTPAAGKAATHEPRCRGSGLVSQSVIATQTCIHNSLESNPLPWRDASRADVRASDTRGGQPQQAETPVDTGVATDPRCDSLMCLPAFLDWLMCRSQVAAAERREVDERAATLTTLHRSKGREWPHVLIVNCHSEELPLQPKAFSKRGSNAAAAYEPESSTDILAAATNRAGGLADGPSGVLPELCGCTPGPAAVSFPGSDPCAATPQQHCVDGDQCHGQLMHAALKDQSLRLPVALVAAAEGGAEDAEVVQQQGGDCQLADMMQGSCSGHANEIDLLDLETQGICAELSRHEDSASGKVEEERRLLYVGMTRARVSLAIVYPAATVSGRPLMPSPFLSELPQALVKIEHFSGGVGTAKLEAIVDSLHARRKQEVKLGDQGRAPGTQALRTAVRCTAPKGGHIPISNNTSGKVITSGKQASDHQCMTYERHCPPTQQERTATSGNGELLLLQVDPVASLPSGRLHHADGLLLTTSHAHAKLPAVAHHHASTVHSTAQNPCMMQRLSKAASLEEDTAMCEGWRQPFAYPEDEGLALGLGAPEQHPFFKALPSRSRAAVVRLCMHYAEMHAFGEVPRLRARLLAELQSRFAYHMLCFHCSQCRTATECIQVSTMWRVLQT